VALLEYLLHVPANRIGNTQFKVCQLKILQEAIKPWRFLGLFPFGTWANPWVGNTFLPVVSFWHRFGACFSCNRTLLT
jgi:uncharacterized protein (DUF486 family)